MTAARLELNSSTIMPAIAQPAKTRQAWIVKHVADALSNVASLRTAKSNITGTLNKGIIEIILPPVPDPKVRGPGNLYRHSRELEMSDRKDYYK
jgi:hypothetical protein